MKRYYLLLLIGFLNTAIAQTHSVINNNITYTHPTVTLAVKFGISPSIRNFKPIPKKPLIHQTKLMHVPFPKITHSFKGTDPIHQPNIKATFDIIPILSFPGYGHNRGPGDSIDAIPPDTTGAVGATQYVQWVNNSYIIFNKTNGQVELGPLPGNTPWIGFGGLCESNNDGDPIILYDKLANRWIFSQFALNISNHKIISPSFQCIAISQTSDAAGPYYLYQFSYDKFNDYGKIGVWPDGYYISYNMFNNGKDEADNFAGPRVCAFERSKMLQGDPTASQQCFQISSKEAGALLPSDADSAIQAPPNGMTNYFVGFNNYTNTSLGVWKFHVNWLNSTLSTLQRVTIPVAPFIPICGKLAVESEDMECILQPNINQQLDSISDRMMYRAPFRYFNDRGYGVIVTNHSVNLGNNVSAIRWYELIIGRNGSVGLKQQGTYAPDNTQFRWLGSIAMDKNENIALGYSKSSTTIFPSIAITGRSANDSLGSMGNEWNVISGNNSQASFNRWGDYSTMTVDPIDDCTFWYTNEYIDNTILENLWSTYIYAFKFKNCQ